MAALTTDRATIRFGALFVDSPTQMPIKAATVIYDGAAVVNDAGYAAPARTATGLVTLGVSRRRYDNTTGAAGAIIGEYDHADFLFDNDGTDLVVAADVGVDCYWSDDHTVSHTATGKSRAGKVIAINPPGVGGVPMTGVLVRTITGL